MIYAAGLLLLTPDNRALFLKRGPGGDHSGEWCWPGGRIEEGETAEQAAVREAEEEIGSAPEGKRALHTRSVTNAEIAPAMPGEAAAVVLPSDVASPVAVPKEEVVTPAQPVDFTTFLQRVPEPFVPVLNDEHTGWAWASVDAPPQPLHPGAIVSIARLTMDELGVARAIAAGELTSPQVYDNTTLFAIRITGTGVSYRSSLGEFVWRDPSVYLNDEFLARCNGLQVIWEHPKRATLNSEEFTNRTVGSILLPYLKGDEVWGIAKIYDAAAIRIMIDRPMSTSPTVVFGTPGSTTKMILEGGAPLLIEGKPSLLDHVAICEAGVWDKGGDPVGVDRSGVEARADAEPPPRRGLDGQKVQRINHSLTLLNIRMSNRIALRK